MKIISTYILLLLSAIAISQDTTYVCYYDGVASFPLDNLNSKSIEFSPMYYHSGIVYVVAREKNRFIDPKTGRAYFDLMYADIGPDGKSSPSVSFSPNIRTQYHEGPCTFNADGTELFFTRSNLSGGQGINDEEGQVQLKIYHATKGSEDWEGIAELPFCSNEYSVAHPALSLDGNDLVFSSDMPGGLGGMDLYVVHRMDSLWGSPVNLGATINTSGHEVFPYWHPGGYLFFSSDGHKGEGGLDVFVSAWNQDYSFIGIQHLEVPFNSSKDDLGFITSADGTSGYFASDRKPTQGKDDLYRWTSPQSIFCALVDPYRERREILVLNEREEMIDKAYVWIIPMGKEGPTLQNEKFNTELVPNRDHAGSFDLRWGITDTLSHKTANATSDPGGKVLLDIDQRTDYIVVVQHDSYEPYVEVMNGLEIPAIIRLKKIPEVSCLNTLFTVYNTTGDAVLNGAQVQLMGSCLKSPMKFYTDINGTRSQCLPKGCTLKAEIQQEGYAQHSFTFTPTDENEHWKIYLKEGHTGPPSPIASGTVIVLDNIYYDFNKSAIRKGDAEELIALAKILKQYPDLTIELTSHTDTRGTSEYNMELSEKRSESSKAYLVLQGVNASRILTKAAGESMPRNKCLDGVPCTEAEHQYNRRTEVKIINPAQGMEIRYKSEG